MIRSIKFRTPVEVEPNPGGIDFWSPSKCPLVAATSDPVGVLLSWDVKAKDGVPSSQRESLVPLTNIAQITWEGARPGKVKP